MGQDIDGGGEAEGEGWDVRRRGIMKGKEKGEEYKKMKQWYRDVSIFVMFIKPSVAQKWTRV